jgi:hypothetical protein
MDETTCSGRVFRRLTFIFTRFDPVVRRVVSTWRLQLSILNARLLVVYHGMRR